MDVLTAVDVLERNSGIGRQMILAYMQVAEAAIMVAVDTVSPEERRKRAIHECPARAETFIIPLGIAEDGTMLSRPGTDAEWEQNWLNAHIADWPNVQAAVEAIRDYHAMLATR